ncbi:unnamed protein product [Paramecium primaurelia]|uniref:Uncharacterized protein n=1 Tax=Paramecium primaurelia TaxID=5886 RepID=A0A8S1P8J2_PARPR|nr:unnamed protein product [Paramecium primaurelia]
MNNQNTIIIKNFFSAFYLFLVLNLAQSSFSYYKDAILTSGLQVIEESINIINEDDKDTYCIGFWSMNIPLQIPIRNFDIEIPFDLELPENGELLLLVKDSDTNDNLIVVFKILDYSNRQVQHIIQFINHETSFNFIFKFNGLDYEGQWIFHLISIQPIKGVVIVEASDQNKQFQILASKVQQNLKIILGGRGYINDKNLNTFRGLLSKLIFLPSFSYTDILFENTQTDNQIPQKSSIEEKIYIIQGLQEFKGYQAQEIVIDQYGKRYCLSGWVKYNYQNTEEEKYTLIRMTNFINYEDKQKLGDELFGFKVLISKFQPQLTKIFVHADAYSMPVQQSFESQYDLTFQGIQNENYKVVQSTKTLEYLEDFRYYEGLQQWHFIQYEYGRSNFDERMLLQLQFYNKLGLIREQLGNDIFRGSFINSKFNIFLGGDNFNHNFLQAYVYDFKIEYNYNEDKVLLLNCHYSCLTCKGPQENDCINCDENTNRYYQSEVFMCKCKQGYFDFGQRICTNQYYSSISIQEIEIQNPNICPFGYFKLPLNNTNFKCIECPQKLKNQFICAECYFYSKTWYLRPVCKQDLITLKNNKDDTFHLIARNPIDYDLYSINLDRELMYHFEFQDYCIYNVATINQCYTFPHYHLGNQAQMKCKENYFVDIDNFRCIKFRQKCKEFDSLGNCWGCFPGKYNVWFQCIECPIGCSTCENINYYENQPICQTCTTKFYNYIDGQCKMCGQYCELCERYYDDQIDQEYLRCIKCIDDSKYHLSLDGKQCLYNQIPNCIHAFQALRDDMTINTLDLKFQPQFDYNQIITLCAKCETSYVFVFEINKCIENTKEQDCQVGIGQLNEIDQSLESIICLSSTKQKNDIVQFTEKCFSYNNNCQVCLQTHIIDSYACLECVNGYYVSIPSGQCIGCPPELKCKSCYSQHSILKDRWKILVRSFYRKYIENNSFHQYIVYGQTQNSNHYEIQCSSCIDGFKLHNNICLQYCQEDCMECIFQNDKYICNKCFYEQRGRRLTLIDNKCIECPENCALCRIRTNEEIQQINPLFNNPKYIKYTYQCIKSYEDQSYYYDQDFGLFIECKQNDQGNGCYKQLIITLNLYTNLDEYYDDLFEQPDEESKIKFQKENIYILNLLSQESSFIEFENDQFYTLANSKLIKTIIIKIISKKYIRKNLNYGGLIVSKFQQNIFTLQNVEIEFIFEFETIFLPQFDFEFINFSKITLQNIRLEISSQSKFIFKSSFPQTIILNDIQFQIGSLANFNHVNFQFTFNNVSTLLVNNMYFYNISLIAKDYFMNIQETNYPKTIIFKNITLLQIDIKTIFLDLSLGDQDYVEIDTVKILSNNINQNIIKVQQKNEYGELKLQNVILSGSQISDSQYIFDFEKVLFLEINHFQMYQTILINTSLILLNRNSQLENIKFQDSQFLKKSIGIKNNNNFYELNFHQIFTNILFENNQYDNLIQFIYLQKYLSQQSNITINYLNQINNYFIKDSLNQYRKQVIFSLIIIQYDYVKISNLVIERGFGLNDITIYDCQEIKIQNGTFQQQKFRFLGLHKYINCQLKQVNAQYYSTTLSIATTKIIELKNLTFSKVQSYNSPIIAIDSADQKLINQSEIIILQDISFSSNIILFTELIFKSSLISISSYQQNNIKINNITFQNNVYNQYTQFDSTTTAGLLLIICPYCKLQLINSLFLNNIVLNSRSSIMYIQTQILQITDCNFYNNSIFIYNLLQPHIQWGFTSQISEYVIESNFKSKSKSGIGELLAEQILIQNNSFINSQGSIGGCFSIFSYGSSDILIQNNRFESISTKFLNDLEYGGVIYIDGSSSSQLKVEINNNIGNKIYCRGFGGFIYLKSNTSQSNLTILNLNLEDIYAQQGSAIYVSYSKFVESPQILFVQKLFVSNTQIGYYNFLNKFKEFSSQQEIQYLINNRSLMYLEYGSLIQINEIKISNIILESLLILQQSKSVYLSQIQVQNSYISNNLISIFSFTTTNQELILQNSIFRSIQIGFNFTNQTDIKCININPSSNDVIYQCLNDFIQAPIQLNSNEEQGNYNKAYCVFQEIISYIDQQNSGLILFNNFTNQNKIQINSVTLVDIICTICQNGLIYLQFQPQVSLIQQQLITSLYVQNCSCGKQGCLNVIQLSNKDNRILNQQELYSLNYELKIRYYICQYNIATQGTCLKINSFLALLQDSLFQFNEAFQEGGSIYIKGNKNLIIEDSVISFNKGSIGGGLYFSDQVAMKLLDNKTKIIKNSAEFYGNNIASNPQQLTIQIRKDSQVLSPITKISNSTIKIQEIQLKPYIGLNGNILKHIYLPTGQKISSYKIFDWKNKFYYQSNQILRILALDGDSNIIQNLQNTECFIESRIFDESKQEDQDFTNNYTNIQRISFNLDTQTYNLDDLIVYFDNSVPQEIVLQLQFTCNSIKVPIYNTQYPYEIIDYHSNYKLRVNVKTYECQYGEIKNMTGFSCEKCDSDQGLYSLTLKSQKCDIKDEITTLSIKDNQLVLRQGYWRPYFDTRAIHFCLNLQENCLGGIKEGDSSCYIGHIGALCEQCDLYNIRGDGQYSIVKKFQCGPCADKERNIFVILGIVILTLVFLLISIQGNRKIMEEFTKSSVFKIYRYQVYLNKNQSGTLIKMLTNYFQIIVSITTFQLSFSTGLNYTLNVVGNPLQTSSYSLDCFLVEFKDLQIEYARMIWQMILPLLYIIVFICIYFLAILIKKDKFNPSIAATAAIYIYIYVQPNLINGFIELISYRNISGFKWIQANVSQRYDTTTHTKWMLEFCLPLITLIAIIIPCFFFFGLYTNKYQFQKKSVMSRWGYLYNEYKKEAYFWELIKIIQKELIILSLVYYEDTVVMKGILVLFITYVYQELNALYQPYQLNNLNQLDYYSANISMITIGLAIGTYISQQAHLIELQIPFFFIMALQNFLFLSKIISKIILEYSKQYEILLDKIKEIIKKRFPQIDQYPFLKRLFKSRVEQRKNALLLFQKLKNFGIPFAKQIIQMRQTNFDQNSSKRKSTSTQDGFYNSKNQGIQYQKNILKIKSISKKI